MMLTMPELKTLISKYFTLAVSLLVEAFVDRKPLTLIFNLIRSMKHIESIEVAYKQCILIAVTAAQ